MAKDLLRRIRLLLDPTAAKAAERDAKGAVGRIEGSLKRMESAARRIGAAIGTFLGVRGLLRFGATAVRMAGEVDRVWKSLAQTVDNAGGSFQAMEQDLRALGEAFQDATVHDAEDFASNLDRLISLTDDVGASVNNMGLVANVAAKFFRGDLAAATELVGKVMNGLTTPLRRMGIVVGSAQEGLEVLAQRSFGQAQIAAQSFHGQLLQLTNLWNDFRENVGKALIESDGATSGMNTLRVALKTLGQEVQSNSKEIGGGFSKALMFAVEVLDGVYRGVRGVAEVLGGVLFFAIGTVLSPLVLLNKGLALLARGGELVAGVLGFKGAAAALDSFEKKVTALAEVLSRPTVVGMEMLGEGLKRFTERTQLAEDLLASMRNPGKLPVGSGRGLFGNKPMLGKGGAAEAEGEVGKVEKALAAFVKEVSTAHQMFAVLGKDFNLLEAEAKALEKVMQELAENGVGAADPRFQGFATRLREVRGLMAEEEIQGQLRSLSTLSKVLGKDFDALSAEASILEGHLQDLLKEGLDENSASVQRLGARLRELRQEIAQRNAFKAYEDQLKVLSTMHQVLGDEFTALGERLEPGAAALDRMRSEVEALQQAIQDMVTAGVDTADPKLAAMVARLQELQGVLAENERQMKFMAEAAELMGQAVGAAMGAGLAPFAASKAKQALIEAAEHATRAIVAAFNPFTAPQAAAHATAAAKFTAIAAAWAALAKGSAAAGIGGGGSGVGSIGGARNATGAAATRAEPPVGETHLHFVGPSIFNPRLQDALLYMTNKSAARRGHSSRVVIHQGTGG